MKPYTTSKGYDTHVRAHAAFNLPRERETDQSAMSNPRDLPSLHLLVYPESAGQSVLSIFRSNLQYTHYPAKSFVVEHATLASNCVPSTSVY